MDDRIFDNYGRIVPAQGSASTQKDMPHEIMMGKLKPRNLDFFDFPHQDMPEMNNTSFRENENMWAVIGEQRDQKIMGGVVPNGSLVPSASFIIGAPSPDHLHQNQSHMITDAPIFTDGYLAGDHHM